MHRIGITASKMAKGNLLAYNGFVVLISFLCSLFIFFVCGFSILVALFLFSLAFRFLMPTAFNTLWPVVFKVSMIALTIAVGVLNVVAIVRNIKLTKNKI